jgi:hypothetical protein
MKERNGRDENNLSHAETPFYKGIPSEYGRDEGCKEILRFGINVVKKRSS